MRRGGQARPAMRRARRLRREIPHPAPPLILNAWNREAIIRRYQWIFAYDVNAVPI
jgi:hypothetical protein